MNTLADFLGTLGVILGVIAFLWNVIDAFGNYLHIDLDVERHDSNSGTYITALASVDNKGRLPKKINYAFLLVGPEDESPIATAKRIAPKVGVDPSRISFTNDISILLTDVPLYSEDGNGALIPLPFFFSEQIVIGDETLKYRCTIDKSKLAKHTSYSVRFLIFGKHHLHRSTHDLLKSE